MIFTLVVNYEKNTASEIYRNLYALEMFNDYTKLMRPNIIIHRGAAVPHLKIDELKLEFNSFNIVYYVLVIISFVIFIEIMVKILNLDERRWRDYRYLDCILGIRIVLEKKIKERTFYFVIILLAFYISNDLMSIVINMELDSTKKAVENFGDLDNMNVPIYFSLPINYDIGDLRERKTCQ